MSHYDVLGVARTADAATVRRAYLDLARRHHPDRSSGADSRRMAQINAAWTVLGDRERRARYDEELANRERRSRPEPPPWRPYDTGPDPAPMPAEDLATPTPARAALTLVPAVLLASTVAAFSLGVVVRSVALFALGAVLLLATLGSFVLAPVVSMYESYRDDPDRAGR